MFKKQRVVITGMGAVSPFGAGIEVLTDSLLNNKSAIKKLDILDRPYITSHVAGLVPEIDFTFIPRPYRRSMTKMSLYATLAAKEALKNACYDNAPKDTALFVGSTLSSMEAWVGFSEKYLQNQLGLAKTTTVFQVLNHSPLANLSQALNIQGQTYCVCNACASGLTNLGLAFQMIRAGILKSALCGATEEYHPILTGCFSLMNAASNAFNNEPEKASRPFDKDRGGIVCSEGCGMLYIESLESALQRGATIYAEIKGFASNTETQSIAHPSRSSMAQCMQMAVEDAQVLAGEIDLVNAHATSTVAGDEEESNAIAQVFGNSIKVNSLKGHLGHTMAACGAIELIAIINMMLANKIAGTLNLDNIDEKCNVVTHIRKTKDLKFNSFVKNSFALGGTNASIVIKRYANE